MITQRRSAIIPRPLEVLEVVVVVVMVVEMVCLTLYSVWLGAGL